MNSKDRVCLHDRYGNEVLFVRSTKNQDVVWLETEDDCDIEYEILTRFQDAIEDGTDEVDVYAAMLEQGIDSFMVRKYIGNEAADHMETFCEEHGLM